MRLFFTGIMLVTVHQLTWGQNVESFGIFSGLNLPFTIDQGLKKDPRFVGKIVLRATPIGFYYGYDKSGYGFAITPSYTQLGQNFKIRNVTGGDVGFREVHMNYFTVPVALKIHINDLSFFRLSLLAALAPSFLVTGKETISHDPTTLNYPPGVSIPTDPGYSLTYNGVIVPQVKNQVYVSKDKFSPIQLFGSLGLRSDFDLSNTWSVNFDGRANFGVFDSRTASYLNTLKNPSGPPDINGKPGAPDLYGARRDFYLSFQVGFCRIIETKEKFRTKRSDRSITPRDIPKPRNRRPKS
jgi:Outer membrane protein beta-barrel domain